MKKQLADRQTTLVKRGFTLMEMMMVMVIIAILAGGVISIMSTSGDDAKIVKSEAELNTLQSAVLSYRSLAGRNPTDAQGLEALVNEPTTPPKPRRYKPGGYLDKIPVDPWDNPYVYRQSGSKDPSTYELLSYGPNGEEGGGDDISSQDL